MLTDIEIAQNTKLDNIKNIANKLDIPEEDLTFYGKYKAKIKIPTKLKPKGKLILVTAINPTPAGEGKTTTSIGLADALSLLGNKTCLALREPSLGPVFGLKGGATGGGYAQVAPMEDINLHFTGDFHAIENANNLLAAMIDNHIYHGNSLNINPDKIIFKRCMDMNDRQLRKLTDGLQDAKSASRTDGFDITVASEVMAIFCLSTSLDDLKRRLGNIIVGYSYDNKPILAKDLNAQGAMTALLKDAFEPNLVQTLEGTPAIIHGGPFANIAHGCNSIVATNTALNYADYVVTEAGFGADLGAEKFLDIKCRAAGLKPDTIVLVATTRALKYNGGLAKDRLAENDLNALSNGLCNLVHHIEKLSKFNIPIVVALNKFATEYPEEIHAVQAMCRKLNVKCILSGVHSEGGKGGIDLANEVINLCDKSSKLNYLYNIEDSLETKISKLACDYYNAGKVVYSQEAEEHLKELSDCYLPICVAKTQYSISDDPLKLGEPEGYDFMIRDIKLSAGAEFIVVYAGKIMTMPGLPKVPAAENIDVIDGKIVGLF